MEISQAMVINLITLVLAVAAVWYLKARWRSIMAEVQAHLFTMHGFVIAVIWAVISVGIGSSLMFVRVSSGDSMSISYPTEEGIKQATKGGKRQ